MDLMALAAEGVVITSHSMGEPVLMSQASLDEVSNY